MNRTHFSFLRTGFTLIELLVVVSIVAILAGLLLPVMNRARESANATKCVSNLRQIGTAFRLYSAEHDGTFPNCWGNWTHGGGERGYWYNALLGNKDPFYNSGSNPWDFRDGAVGSNYLGSRDVLVCPTIRSSGGGYGSWGLQKMEDRLGYGMTALPVTNPKIYNSGNSDSGSATPNRFFTLRLQKPSEWPLIMDANVAGIWNLNNPTESQSASNRYIARHNDWANVLMVDGHVEKVEYGDQRWRESELNDGTYY